MTPYRLWRVRNAMLLANGLANLAGFLVVQLLVHRADPVLAPAVAAAAARVDWLYVPAAFAGAALFTLAYEQPTRRLLRRRAPLAAPAAELLRGRQRLLNEPLVLMALDLGLWLLAAVVYGWFFHVQAAGPLVVQTAILRAVHTGLITATIAFFILEAILQHRLAPILFPGGGLAGVPGTVRIRIRTRLLSLLLATNLIPLLSIYGLVRRLTAADPQRAALWLQAPLVTNLAVFAGVGIGLTLLVSRSLSRPLGRIVQRLEAVRQGSLAGRLQVTASDELGYCGDVINEMTEGLREGERMRQGLELAREVQENLLPRTVPAWPGVEVAGLWQPCEETSGDYYDYLERPGSPPRLGLVVADVSDHGIPSALLMTTVRALLRLQARQAVGPAALIAAVNEQLVTDIEPSGRFVTLFYAEIDSDCRELVWVRAGHEPALLYDPGQDSCQELAGPGLALGVMAGAVFQEGRTRIPAGGVLLIGTDGLWETRSAGGSPLGKERLRQLLCQQAGQPAAAICDVLKTTLAVFAQGRRQEDDVTAVIARFP
ncbi:MAG: SpoIIE family protein phosphatase [Thermodesulfobacteriota bacterium]